jgi:hypothetical protein
MSKRAPRCATCGGLVGNACPSSCPPPRLWDGDADLLAAKRRDEDWIRTLRDGPDALWNQRDGARREPYGRTDEGGCA